MKLHSFHFRTPGRTVFFSHSVLIGMLLFCLNALNAETLGDYNFTDNGTSITITRYTGAGGDVVIPATLINKPVTEIGKNAFYSSPGLSSISIPASVTSIGNNAFYACSALTTLNIPPAVTSIGNAAFYACSKLSSVYFAGNAPTLGSNVFFNTASNFTIYFRLHALDFSEPTWNDYPAATYGQPLFYNSIHTIDFGGDFRWNNLFGYSYTGYHPFVFDFATDQWLYFNGESEYVGYYLYSYKLEHWCYTQPDFYEDRWILDLDTGFWLVGLESPKAEYTAINH